MATKFNFESQICTTREQSERLLALGVKKETADCCWTTDERGNITISLIDDAVEYIESAWSLGRLLEIMRMKASSQIVPLDNTFDRLIEGIETRIKESYFNKEYLEINE